MRAPRSAGKRLRLIFASWLGAGALALLAASGPAPATGPFTVDARTGAGLRELFKPTGERFPLLSAHRGGAGEGWPENCLATFEHTIRHAWSMLEIDLRYTRDGVLVLNHDPTLERTTNGKGRVADYTLAELRQFRLKDRRGNLTDHSIPTLDEVMRWARGRTILVLDKKEVPVKDVVRKIAEHRAESYAMVMAYSIKEIAECHALNADLMMEVMIGNRQRFDEFARSGVPWPNIIAFVGHTATPDAELCRLIRAKGASCMAGTSRNIDRELLGGRVADVQVLRPQYEAVLKLGVDVIETDIPREVGPVLHGPAAVTGSKAGFFRLGR